ncbi:DUF2167 domain-containing protein [Asticcacaulis sp. BYS171W]|uniref:DUF2167 domain-containing protein n=1 Tax=Asticcacaulis aquaticus TaxID=2984212 RepID=A0ABT5HV52_9CAUL|nr:DUF2167 domain-containing protein [Asticcacaulis aquaticus]MDC7683924.1 DUF2167 domain-containing protein [Asticcacaulis aquaticus]
MLPQISRWAAVAVMAAGVAFSGAVHAAPVPDAAAQASAEAELAKASDALMAGLHPMRGDVTLSEAHATLHLGKAYYFLNAAEARKVIVDIWGNPPDQADGVLGMIVPEGRSPINDWGAIVTYEETGYVSDHDANSTDYDKYIKDLQAGEAEENKARKEAGYGTTHLVGWAQAPSYDKASHSMVWARNIQFEGSEVNSLNYDIRLLGRQGVLSINMIATLPELPVIREQARQLAGTGQFDDGFLYAQYKPGDAKAAFGVGGMVAAGLGLAAAKKFGLLALLLVVLKKGWFLLILAAGAVKAWFGKLFGKKTPATTRTFSDAPEGGPDGEGEPEPSAPEPAPSIVEDASNRR